MFGNYMIFFLNFYSLGGVSLRNNLLDNLIYVIVIKTMYKEHKKIFQQLIIPKQKADRKDKTHLGSTMHETVC